MRVLVLVHRYLGIAIGPLVLMWCLSGVVMMYVPYPRLTEAARRGGLPPIDWAQCCGDADRAFADEQTAASEVEMLAGRGVLRTKQGGLIDLSNGSVIRGVTVEQAAAVAADFAARSSTIGDRPSTAPQLLGIVADDAWTVSGVPSSARPLYHFAVGDRSGAELYVSSTNGKIVQETTARERFWGWLGSIPHWLYLVPLRRHVRVWSAVVITASLVGCFLIAVGVAIGVTQSRKLIRRRKVRHRGTNLAHHVAGLVFGIAALGWAVSGFLSMNPFGLLQSRDTTREEAMLRGSQPSSSRVLAAVRVLARSPSARRSVSVEAAPLGGRLHLVSHDHDGTGGRFDDEGRSAPLTIEEINDVARALPGGIESSERLTTADAYFFGHPGREPPLPVYRIVSGDAQHTRLYLDPVSGTILTMVDRNAKGYRWLHQALHRFDAWPVLRWRPLWDVLMLSLLAGVAFSSATGLFLGLRRLLARPAAQPLRSPAEASS